MAQSSVASRNWGGSSRGLPARVGGIFLEPHEEKYVHRKDLIVFSARVCRSCFWVPPYGLAEAIGLLYLAWTLGLGSRNHHFFNAYQAAGYP